MSVTKEWVRVPGSHRTPRAAAAQLPEAELNQRSYVTVLLHRRADIDNSKQLIDEILSRPPWLRRTLTREQFEASLGSDPRDLQKIHEFADEYGLDVV
jgi:hypothetical protein